MPTFIRGARVDGLYDRNEDNIWYPGYVEEVHQLTLDDGTLQQSYDILYDDGEREQQVLENYIRSHAEGTISMGTRVSCKYAGGDEWYTGSIFEVQDILLNMMMVKWSKMFQRIILKKLKNLS
jgi:hypothetical protein